MSEQKQNWIDEAVDNLPALLHVSEVERLLRIKRRKTNQLVADGSLKGVRHRSTGSSPLLITRASVADYLRSISGEPVKKSNAAPDVECTETGNGTLVFWCTHCERNHAHGLGYGHRVAHCTKPDSPYKLSGYNLIPVGGESR